jgi:hypothetical protein
VKAGTRALGVAESYVGTDDEPAARSTLCCAVVRADRVVDGLAFGTCTVGGTDATDAVARLVARTDREDARFLFLAGIAPAWYNLLDLDRLHEAVDRPVVAVSFESSPGLERALRAAFDGEPLAARLATYESLPARQRVPLATAGDGTAASGGFDGASKTERGPEAATETGTDTGCGAGNEAGPTAGPAVWVRSVGCSAERAARLVRTFTRDGRRPEPLRVAQVAARAGDEFRRRVAPSDAGGDGSDPETKADGSGMDDADDATGG